MKKTIKGRELLQFSDKDIETITGFIIYGLGEVAHGMLKEDWWQKHMGTAPNDIIPQEIITEIGKTLNDSLRELQDYGEVL